MKKPITVLLVDDDEDDRETFLIAMEEIETKGECVTVSSCFEAMKYLNSEEPNPDFIFMDLNMPQVDGRECLCELKQTSKFKDIPVVIFSTSSLVQDIQETQTLGASGFITKPSKISELCKLLDNFFQKQSENIKIIQHK